MDKSKQLRTRRSINYAVLSSHEVIEIAASAVGWAYDIAPMEVLKKRHVRKQILQRRESYIKASFHIMIHYLMPLIGDWTITNVMIALKKTYMQHDFFADKHFSFMNDIVYMNNFQQIKEVVDRLVYERIKSKY